MIMKIKYSMEIEIKINIINENENELYEIGVIMNTPASYEFS